MGLMDAGAQGLGAGRLSQLGTGLRVELLQTF